MFMVKKVCLETDYLFETLWPRIRNYLSELESFSDLFLVPTH